MSSRCEICDGRGWVLLDGEEIRNVWRGGNTKVRSRVIPVTFRTACCCDKGKAWYALRIRGHLDDDAKEVFKAYDKQSRRTRGAR